MSAPRGLDEQARRDHDEWLEEAWLDMAEEEAEALLQEGPR